MDTRTSSSQVTFRRPFRLPGMQSDAPAGCYQVLLEEERLNTLTTEVWRHTAAVLQIASVGLSEHVSVEPQALRDALLRDGEDGPEPQAPLRTRAVLGMRRR